MCAPSWPLDVAPLEAVEQGQQNNPTMTREDERSYVNAAITVWCPRQAGLYPLA